MNFHKIVVVRGWSRLAHMPYAVEDLQHGTVYLYIITGDTSYKQNTFNHEIEMHLAKGIKNGCPCIVEIRGTQGCALVGDPARAVGECRDVAKAQP